MDAGTLMKVVVFLDKNVLAPFVTMAFVSAIDSAIQRKMSGKGVVRVGKRITLAIRMTICMILLE